MVGNFLRKREKPPRQSRGESLPIQAIPYTNAENYKGEEVKEDSQEDEDDPLENLVFSDDATALHNQKVLGDLYKKQGKLTTYAYLASGMTLASMMFPIPGTVLTTLPPLGAVFKEFQKITRICRAAENLIKNFSGQGVLVTQQIDVPENGTVDLFVRFPNPPKAVFLVGLRSNGESKVFFNEAKEALYFQRKRGGLRAWQVDLFRRFALQEFWLRKNRQDLFGQSSRDKNRAAVKLLVLTGDTKLGQHSEHLYTEIGGQKVLCVRNRISLYIMEDHQLAPFIQGWLNKSNTPDKS